MASPGRIVQKGGKSVYEPLTGDDLDSTAPDDPIRAGVKHCPSERVTWPEYDASCWSRVGFSWFDPIVQLGAQVPLEMSDLWTLHEKESSAKNVPEFMALWEEEKVRAEKVGEKPGLLRPVWNHSWRIVVPAGVLLLSGCFMQFLRPLLMQQILLVVENDPENPPAVPREYAWTLAVAIAVCAICDFLSFSHYNMFVMKSAWRLRQALVGILFSKVTKLSQGTKASYSQGKITNMMSSDVDRLRMSVRRVNDLWLIPTRFILALYFVVAILGVTPALSGLGVMIVLIPITKKFVKKLRKYQQDILKYTDERVKITQEVMAGIRIIKLMAWEKSFYDKIGVIRNQEIQKIRVQAVYRALYFSLSMSVPIITTTLALAVYTVVGGNRLTASTAFPALSLLNTLREPLQALPEVLMALLVEGRISLDRMNA
jgi:ABC-type multidrug transport system fused ATPase/permease subunit